MRTKRINRGATYQIVKYVRLRSTFELHYIQILSSLWLYTCCKLYVVSTSILWNMIELRNDLKQSNFDQPFRPHVILPIYESNIFLCPKVRFSHCIILKRTWHYDHIWALALRTTWCCLKVKNYTVQDYEVMRKLWKLLSLWM